MKTTGLDKFLKLTIIFAIILVSFSLFYYFFWRPYQDNIPYKKCIEWKQGEKEEPDLSDYINCEKHFK